MKKYSILLLIDRSGWWARLRHDCPTDAISHVLIFTAIATAAYGSTLGLWHSPTMMLYTSIKFPLVVIGSTFIVTGLNWLLAQLSSSGLQFKQILALTLSAMALMSWILLALLPIIVFFLLTSAGTASGKEEIQLAHNSVLLLHVCCIGSAGTVGVQSLWQGILELASEQCNHSTLLLGWLASFAFVGCQLSWMLRPFIGSPFYPVQFFRADAFNRNFYEFILFEVLPFVFTKGGLL